MEGRRFGVFGACLCGALACSGVWGAQEPTRSDRSAGKDLREAGAAPTEEQSAVEFAAGETYPIPPNTPRRTVVIGDDSGQSVVAGLGIDREIYTNRFGYTGINASTGLIADDITTTAKDGSKLTRYSFEVIGRVNPAIAGGNFSVTYALYNTCPGAVSTTAQVSRQVPGTAGSLTCTSDCDGIITIEHVVDAVMFPAGAPVPPRMWLGLKFSRTNAGPVAGSPPEEGFSYNVYHTSSFKCETGLAPNFPEGPYAAFNARLWAGTDLEPSAPMSIGYHSHREKPVEEAAVYNPGAEKWVVDDLLFQNSCRMVGYVVTVSKAGLFSFEFRPSCDAGPISGTQRQFSNGDTTRNLVFMLDNPVNLGVNSHFAAKVSNAIGRILAGAKPIVGRSEDLFAIQEPGGECVFQNAIPGLDDALAVTVICEGAPPVGACCDMFVPQCVGGPDEGKGCRTNAHCASPGTCERSCRQLPDANCTFPPEDTTLVPAWEQDEACSPNPFPNAPCGVAACCHYDANEEANCTNLVQNSCPPFGGTHQWQIGEICGLQQRCPLIECLGKPNPCGVPAEFPMTGCNNSECCSVVCEQDPDCCNFHWDAICVEIANDKPECRTGGRPPYDDCWSTRPGVGALEIDPPLLGFEVATSTCEEIDDEDPPVCCHEKRCLLQNNAQGAECLTDANCAGQCVNQVCVEGSNHGNACTSHADCPPAAGSCRALRACLGGDEDGRSCITNADCPFGTCEARPPFALNTAWFKFVADDFTGVNINTFQTSSTQPRDSIIQLFAAGDPTSDQTACATLTPVGCSDDSTNGNPNTLSRLCVSNLRPNVLYYVMIGAKTREAARTNYRVSFATSACTGSTPDAVGEDWCAKAPNAGNGNTSYTFPTKATLDCPGDSCAPLMTKDVWFNYTATCTGNVDVKTCHIPSATPDTTLAVYTGCDVCPGPGDTTPYCNDNNNVAGLCPAGSPASGVRVEGVTLGDCLKIRIGDKNGNTPNGTLNIFCDSHCDPGTVTFLNPPNGVVDAGRPHDPFFLDPALGIQEIRAQGPPGVELAGCWRVDCESAIGDEANFVEDIAEDPMAPGTYVIRLARPISTEASTIVRYLGNPTNDPGSAIRMIAHPGNVLGDFLISWDIAISTLVNIANDENAGNAVVFPPWGEKYGADINRSGDFSALDVLDAIDLANAAETYEPINIIRPSLCTP